MSKYLIIGASSGIGRQLAKQLTEAGHDVFGTYNKNKISTEDNRIQFHFINVLDENIVLDFLPDEIDGMVYCPGAINLRPFKRIKAEEFAHDYNLQLIGAVKTIQAVLPKLTKTGSASLVLFSTVAVQAGFNFHSLVAASKGAVEGLTRALAAEFAPDIRVNCIAPSLTDTPLASALLNSDQKREANAQRNPLKKIGTAGNIADMAAFLLSDKSGWITGQVFHVDGGMGSLRIN